MVKSAGVENTTPVPERADVCVPSASATERLAVKLPVEAGENETAMVQELPAASVAPQVSDPSWKEEAFAPVSATEVIDRAALPALARVKVWAALLLPAPTLLKFAEVAVRAACGAAAGVDATPVPVKVEVCVPASSTMVRVAEDGPALVGEKTIRIWQELPGGSAGRSRGLDPRRVIARLRAGLASAVPPVAQLSLTTMKLFGFAPPSEIDVMTSAALPAFESVKVCAELAAPVVMLPKSAVAGDSDACGAEVVTALPMAERTTVRGDPGWLRSWIE
jgi:hypothetical protein